MHLLNAWVLASMPHRIRNCSSNAFNGTPTNHAESEGVSLPMNYTILQVADCPHVSVLVHRIRQVDGDAVVSFVVVGSDAEAVSMGMWGSPTLLIEGRDVAGGLAEPGGSLSCQMLVPTVEQIGSWVSVAQL
jgi:hypothetical protein